MSASDLPARILAEIKETERIAHAVEDNSAPWDGQWKSDHGRAVRTYNDWVLVYPHGDNAPLRPGLAEHIAHNDLATVLRRCAADRRILELHQQVEADLSPHSSDKPTGCVTCHNDPDCGWTLGNGVCGTVIALAEGYGITVNGAA